MESIVLSASDHESRGNDYIFWGAMAKNGSTRCFFGKKRMYLKTIAVESVVGRI